MKKVNYRVNRDIILDIDVPHETSSYKPLSNEMLVDLTLKAISDNGFKLKSEEYLASSNLNVVTAKYTISSVGDNEMNLMIGWQNSYDKTVSFKFAMGAKIIVCENGCVSGELGTIKKKHMGKIQQFAPNRMKEYIDIAANNFNYLQNERDIMKNIEISNKQKSEIIGRLFIDEEILLPNQLSIVKKEIKTPSINYQCPNTLWELYNHVTFSLKECPPKDYLEKHIQVHNFFEEVYNDFLISNKSVLSEQILNNECDVEL
jgi:hypothetical protein